MCVWEEEIYKYRLSFIIFLYELFLIWNVTNYFCINSDIQHSFVHINTSFCLCELNLLFFLLLLFCKWFFYWNIISLETLFSLLQVLEGDLDQMHLFSYKIPPDCENIILSDKLIFATVQSFPASNEQYILKIFSRKYSEISSENSKKVISSIFEKKISPSFSEYNFVFLNYVNDCWNCVFIAF